MKKTPVQADVAQRLKWARSRIFNTASEAAEALDMKPVTLRAHENGQNGVNIYDLERYARRFNVSLQWLLTGDGPEKPTADQHVELGEMVPIDFVLEARSWLPYDDPSRKRISHREGLREMVPYTDPRFPAPMVEAVRVEGCSPLGHYISGTILFIVEVADLGYAHNDHVIVYRERGEFVNTSVRRVVREGQEVFLHSLTDPDEPPLVMGRDAKEALPHITAVVIGSLTRRPVRELDIETLQHWEAYEKSKHTSPKEFRAMIRDAQAIVSGKKSAEKSEIFDSVEAAEKFLSVTDRSD